MIKLLLPLFLIFIVVYVLYCGFAYVNQQSDEVQVTFYETLVKHLGIFSICFLITAGIALFIVINF